MPKRSLAGRRVVARAKRRSFMRRIMPFSAPKRPIRGMMSRGVHYFKRSINLALATSDVAVDGTFVFLHTNNFVWSNNASAAGTNVYGTISMTFSLQSLPSLSEFTTLFDSYQIRKVVMKLIPYANVVDSLDNSAAAAWADWSGQVHSAIDHDGVPPVSTTEAGISQLQQYVSYKNQRLVSARPLTWVIKPRFLSATISAANTVISDSQGPRNQWLNLANTTLPHYGFGAIFEGVSPAAVGRNIPFRLEATYYLKFKTPR